MQSVYLPPVSPDHYKGINYDPQQVTAKEPHRAIFYGDSVDNPLQLNKVDIVMSSIRTSSDTRQLLCEGISRFKIDNINMNYVSPNVNPYNNTITFFSTATLSYHTATLDIGFYDTPDALLIELVSQLNSIGASGLTFNYVLLTGSPDRYELSSIGGMYFFDLTSPLIVNGRQLIALPEGQIADNLKIGGSVSLFYTRYIDICSDLVSKYEKIKTTSTNSNSNIIVRMYLDSGNEHRYINYSDTPDISYNFLDVEPVYAIDFQLRDEFGNLLYIPDDEYSFSWGISLILEY